jgi:hypothetical protein
MTRGVAPESAMLTDEEARLIAAALALSGRSQEWLSAQLKIPKTTLRAKLYLQRAVTHEQHEDIWKALERAGVKRMRSGRPGVQLR